jgi:hypothetical protein
VEVPAGYRSGLPAGNRVALGAKRGFDRRVMITGRARRDGCGGGDRNLLAPRACDWARTDPI